MSYREVTPNELSAQQLSIFIQRRGRTVPNSIDDRVILAQNILAQEGRTTVMVEQESPSIASRLRNILFNNSDSRSDHYYDRVPTAPRAPVTPSMTQPPVTQPHVPPAPTSHQPIINRINRGGLEHLSTIHPVRPLEPQNTPSDTTPSANSVDSFEVESQRAYMEPVSPTGPLQNSVHFQSATPQGISRHPCDPVPNVPVSDNFIMRPYNVNAANVNSVVNATNNGSNNAANSGANNGTNTGRNMTGSHRRVPAIKFKYIFRLGQDDISDFLLAVKRHADLMSMTDSESILLALSHFKELSESNLIDDGLTNEERQNFELFRSKLIQSYGMTKQEWLEKFENAVRTELESPAQLLNRLTISFRNGIGKKVLTDDNRSTIVRKFKHVINPKLKAHLESKDIESYFTISTEAAKIERAFSIPRVKSASFKTINTINSIEPKYETRQAPETNHADRVSKNKYFCHICEKDSHGTQYCFLNPRGPRFKGFKFAEKSLQKEGKMPKN